MTLYFDQKGYEQLHTLTNQYTSVFILVDENTKKHCLPLFLKKNPSLSFQLLNIAPGENFKNLDTCEFLWDQLAEKRADRKSLLLNLGGGVITDLGGFVASCFKRGIDFINIPTTLLGMVDAAIGGKTGVDLGVLKNQIGVFAHPNIIIIDTDFLETLHEREFKSGVAEMLKYGLSYRPSIWNRLTENTITREVAISCIKESIEIKNEVVAKDPKEAHLRKVLNFGHTFGHAIESHFLNTKEPLTHGEAIAIGMVIACYFSVKTLRFNREELDLIKQKIVAIYGKKIIQKSDYKPIIELLIHDKKNEGNQINFVLLEAVGKYALNCSVDSHLFNEALDFYNL